MTSEEAQEIVDLWFGENKIGAIRRLRDHSAMGLLEAKQYLLEAHDQNALFVKLCTDYVQSVHDLLQIALTDRRRLDLYIEDLVAQSSGEPVPTKENVFDTHPNEEPNV